LIAAVIKTMGRFARDEDGDEREGCRILKRGGSE